MAKTKREDMNEEQKEIANDLSIASALDAVAISEGGKILAKTLLTDVVSDIETLSVRYKELTIQEFIGTCADLKAKLDLYRSIVRAPEAKAKLKDDLKEALGE